jgi:flagellar hook-basal body complex protein FliE
MIPAISGALTGAGWNVGSVGSVGSVSAADTVDPSTAVSGAGSGSFGSALTGAMNSLEQTQTAATQASQGLATGTLTDPTQAVTAVENASLSMDLAAQIRDKLDAAESTIFQTQV